MRILLHQRTIITRSAVEDRRLDHALLHPSRHLRYNGRLVFNDDQPAMLHLFNNLSRAKEPFHPLEPGRIGMYVCGVTVYDQCHVGHGRTYVAFDNIQRWLRCRGYRVSLVRNITDIDDRIIQRAREQSRDIGDLTREMTTLMHSDFAALGILQPDAEPRATDSIDGMLEVIGELMDQGHAYQGSSGDIYFHVPSFDDYGALSRQNLEQLQAGERVEVASDKRSPLDFVLWKHAQPDEPSWDSPWGAGRPGWHIECSAMARAALGKAFDIHGGGSDLLFPHHENEKAQSEAAHGCVMARYWMHTGMVQVDEEKMSKSLGNFFTIREVLDRYRPETVRFFLSNSHYRSQLSYSDSSLESADSALERLYLSVRGHVTGPHTFDAADLADEALQGLDEAQAKWWQRFSEAMDDDFNTADAIAVLFDISREINRCREQPQTAASHARFLRRIAACLGLLQQDPETFLQSRPGSLEDSEVEALIEKRNAARKARDWAAADAARDQLAAAGIVLEDSREGTRWRRS